MSTLQADLLTLLEYNMLNSTVALVGYYVAAYTIDLPYIGRRRMQVNSAFAHPLDDPTICACPIAHCSQQDTPAVLIGVSRARVRQGKKENAIVGEGLIVWKIAGRQLGRGGQK